MSDQLTYVYVIAAQDDGRCKVGIADNPEKRARHLQNGNPDRISVIFKRPYQTRRQAIAEERRVLREFREHRLASEWLRVQPQIVIQSIEGSRR